MLEILAEAGARGYTEGVAAFYHQQALAALDSVRGEDAALADLRKIAEGLVQRRS